MALPAARKLDVVGWALQQMKRHFDVVGTAEHAARLAMAGVRRTRSAASAGPRSTASVPNKT